MSEYLKQAKEEKEQIIYAYHNGCADQISVPKRGYKPEQYYNEKFKK
jgi:hypothetical protein